MNKADESELLRRRFAALERQHGAKNPGFIVNGKKTQNLQYAHKMVVEVAKGIAHALYEAMMKSDEVNAVWKAFCRDLRRGEHEAEFVRLATPWLLDDARANLAGILGQPGKEDLKPAIYDALIKDNSIRGTNGLVPVAQNILETYDHGR